MVRFRRRRGRGGGGGAHRRSVARHDPPPPPRRAPRTSGPGPLICCGFASGLLARGGCGVSGAWRGARAGSDASRVPGAGARSPPPHRTRSRAQGQFGPPAIGRWWRAGGAWARWGSTHRRPKLRGRPVRRRSSRINGASLRLSPNRTIELLSDSAVSLQRGELRATVCGQPCSLRAALAPPAAVRPAGAPEQERVAATPLLLLLLLRGPQLTMWWR